MEAAKRKYHEFQAAHTRLKKAIHRYRMPLPRWGINVMKCVYFSIPVVGGYFVMEYAKAQSDKKWQDKIAVRDTESKTGANEVSGVKIGAGGYGGGVKLAESNGWEQEMIRHRMKELLSKEKEKAKGGKEGK